MDNHLMVSAGSWKLIPISSISILFFLRVLSPGIVACHNEKQALSGTRFLVSGIEEHFWVRLLSFSQVIPPSWCCWPHRHPAQLSYPSHINTSHQGRCPVAAWPPALGCPRLAKEDLTRLWEITSCTLVPALSHSRSLTVFFTKIRCFLELREVAFKSHQSHWTA